MRGLKRSISWDLDTFASLESFCLLAALVRVDYIPMSEAVVDDWVQAGRENAGRHLREKRIARRSGLEMGARIMRDDDARSNAVYRDVHHTS